jgi:hypothetical protein
VSFEPERYPYVERDPLLGQISLAPFLPLTLSRVSSVESMALLDTGSSVNVLPFHVGEELGAIWELQNALPRLSGNLATLETRGLVLSARIGNFPVVELAFAWAKSDTIPILLGQMNFFLEFDVCFHRSRSSFEVRPRSDSSSNNPH